MFLKSHFCNLNKILYFPNIFFNCQILSKMVKKIIFGTKNNYYFLAFQVKTKKKWLYFSWTFPMESPNSKKFLLLIIMTEEKTVASFGVCSLFTKIPQQITLHKSYIIQLYIFCGVKCIQLKQLTIWHQIVFFYRPGVAGAVL